MRFFFTLLIIFGFPNDILSQNFNVGFEDWSNNVNFYPVPAETSLNTCHLHLMDNSESISSSGTITDNAILPDWSAQPFGILRTTDSHTGTYAAIVNMWYNGAKGLLAFGNSADVYTNIPKVAFSNKIYGISGYYKYYKDSFLINDTLKKGTLLNIATYKVNSSGVLEEITRDSLKFATTSNYKPFSLAISYSTTSVIPDSVSIWFESKGYGSGTTSCTLSHFLYLDDLEFHFSPLSIKENLQLKVKIFPNPTQEMINIEYPNDIEVYKIKIIDLLGKTIKIFANNKGEVLYVNDLAKGTYFLRIDAKQGSFSKKFVVR